ncbi:MAG TPA: T9SS type A sorting domain-containing protein [candidate division WOR-3 bacterium]|uniref:T9SS type A sorting domain-containing protein n=1 Tax=candidate division WOR-3 bacterium TaxID=2052148 RepID=A0A7V0XEY4_UNCW3|nr:T9SS type A sorting domain-containing protein [candidate division WOR-3 bacterium]
MRNVMLIALLPALMLAASVTQPMTALAPDVAPEPNEPVTKVERPAPPAQPFVMVGIVDTIGGTTCDWQFNGPMGRYLMNATEYGLHATWMYSASDQTTYPDRNMRYNFYDYATGEWNWIDPDHMQSGVNVYTERTGYGTLEVDPATGVAYVSTHLGTAPLRPELARDLAPGGGLFEYCNSQPNADAYLWPYMAVDGEGAVHFALIDDASRDQLFYSKVDPWCEWTIPVGVAAPQPDPAFPTQGIAASRVSQKVAITWEYSEGAPDPGFYRISEDGGVTWQNPEELPWPAAYGGDTLTSYHISSLYPFYDSNDNLHIVAGVMPYVGGQGYIIPAQLWHWSPSNTPNWSHIHTADPENLLAPVGYNALFACRVTIGEGADGNLFIAWEQFDGENVEPGPPELLRADIYAAGSADNGQTWTEPLQLTQPTTGSKRFPVISDQTVMMNDAEHVAVLYIIDEVAGMHVQGQGPGTNNPVIVHWVPTSQIGVAEPGQGVKPVKLEVAARPNPFGNRTSISYAVPRAGNVSLTVYDVAGRPVRTLVNGRQNAGRYSVNWDGRSEAGDEVAAGIYFYTLTAGQASTTSKLTVVR